MENKQRAVEREVRELVQKYNILEKNQIYAFFEVDGRSHFVGRALKLLEKDRSIYINQETQQVAISEEGYAAWERGTIQSVWVLISAMSQKKIELHFMAEKAEYPVRIVFVGDGDIFDIVYIAEEDIQLANNLFKRKKSDDCGHIVVVEQPEHIAAIEIPNVVGYCTVKEDGSIEYYRKD